jgi:hypothetical protein
MKIALHREIRPAARIRAVGDEGAAILDAWRSC